MNNTKPLLKCFICYQLIIIAFTFFFAGKVIADEKTIGVVMTGKIPYYQEIHRAFINELNQSGIITQENVKIILQQPAPEPMAWTNAIRKIVVFDADIIVTYGAPVTLAAINETSKIPLIFAGVYDPEAVNISNEEATGISSKVPIATVIKNLKGISGFSRLGIIYNNAEKDTVAQANEIRKLEDNFEFKSVLFNIKRKGDEYKIKGVDSLYMTTSCAAMYCINNIIGVARRAKIPTATTIGGGEDIGVLLTIAADPAEQGKKAAQMVARVIKGSKPSLIPIERPGKFYMVINLKEAKALGLKVPFGILTSATRIIK